MGILVRVESPSGPEDTTMVCFYGNKRRYHGDEFEIDNLRQKSIRMVVVGSDGKEIVHKKKPTRKEPPVFKKKKSR